MASKLPAPISSPRGLPSAGRRSSPLAVPSAEPQSREAPDWRKGGGLHVGVIMDGNGRWALAHGLPAPRDTVAGPVPCAVQWRQLPHWASRP